LVEHAKEFTWNEDKLKKLYDANQGWLKKYDKTVSYDNMALKTTFKVEDLEGIFELSISISEEEGNMHAMRPLCIDFER
jgi:hypothetical protein